MRNIYAVVVLDDSGSMRTLKSKGQSFYDKTINDLFDQKDKNTNIFVSTVLFGSKVSVIASMTKNKDDLNIRYSPSQVTTSLFDGIMKGIDEIEAKKPTDKDACLLIVITDGLENSSSTPLSIIKNRMSKLNRLDNWTIAINLPPGEKNNFIKSFNFPADNCREWETTDVGLEETEHFTSSAIKNYASSFKAGNLRSVSKGFYAHANINTHDLSTNKIKKTLEDVTSDFYELKVDPLNNGVQIRDFVLNRHGVFNKGIAFYQVTKKEIIQPQKELIVEANGKLYTGKKARDLLGIPHNVYSKVKPEDYPSYRVFCMSTSTNRKLVAGTSILVRK